jgi:hypothetical protein
MPRFTVCVMAVPYCQFEGRPQALTLMPEARFVTGQSLLADGGFTIDGLQ